MKNQILKDGMQLTINVEIVVVEDSEYFVAYCPALELSAYGNSEETAMQSFNKEVHIFIEETHNRGTLEKYLLKNGWRLQQFPDMLYEPPRADAEKLFHIFKTGKEVIRQDIQIPVY